MSPVVQVGNLSPAPVTAEAALSYSAVLACVRVIAESVASLPLILYRRRSDGGKERAADHRLYRLLHDAPNDFMSSFAWRETMMLHLLLWGNAYSQIVRDDVGRVISLWPLDARRMEVVAANGGIFYRYRDARGSLRDLPREQVLHVAWMSADGIRGISPLSLAREAISLGLTLAEYGSQVFRNGARPGGVLKHPGSLSEQAYQRLKQSFEEQYSGVANAGRTIILEEGMTWERISFPPEDAQFLQTRKFQITEIARIYRVPLHMINEMERATWGNVEHMALEFVQHTLRPWLVRWEQAINQQLLSTDERDQLFVEFLIDGLLRGDIESRYRAYAIGRQWGWFSINDIRAKENMNPVAGGDDYLSPLNMQVIGDENVGEAELSS